MELAYEELPLVVGMMLSLAGAGAFAVLAALAKPMRYTDARQARSADLLFAIPGFAVLFGVLSLLLALPSSSVAKELSAHEGVVAALPWACIAVFLAIDVFAFVALSLTGRLTLRVRERLIRSAGVLGLLYVVLTAALHAASGSSTWQPVFAFLQVIGCSLAGGAACAALVEESAQAGGSSAKPLLVSVLAVGTVLGIGGFAAQAAFVAGIAAEAFSGAAFVEAASHNIAVGMMCLAASCVFGIMGVRMKEKGFHSVVAVASSFVGSFCAYLVLYTA